MDPDTRAETATYREAVFVGDGRGIPRRRGWRYRRGASPGTRRRVRLPLDTRSRLGLLVGITLIIALGALAAGLAQYWRSFAQNSAADLIGAVMTIFVITPIIERAGQNRVRDHPYLDYQWFLERMRRAGSVVRVLDTYSNLLLEPYAGRFHAVVRTLLQHGVSVQILLLNPTTLAADQRALELGDVDMHHKIMQNLGFLREFRHSFDQIGGGMMGTPFGATFEVRLYTSAPSITLYQCDDRSLVSFYPIGRGAGQSAQLEVGVDTPIGQFVGGQFNELWRRAAPHETVTRVTLTTGAVERSYLVKFVEFGGFHYVVSTRVENFLRNATGEVRARHGDDLTVRYELCPVDASDNQLRAVLDTRFRNSYGESPNSDFLRLRPVTPQVDA